MSATSHISLGHGTPLTGAAMRALVGRDGLLERRVTARASSLVSALVRECCDLEESIFVEEPGDLGVDCVFVELSQSILHELSSVDQAKVWFEFEAMLRPGGRLVILSSRACREATSQVDSVTIPSDSEYCEVELSQPSSESAASLDSVVSLLVERGYNYVAFRQGRHASARFRAHSGHRLPQAYILNNYLSTAGGGERSTLDYAFALDRLGFSVTLVSTTPQDLTLAEVLRPFFDGPPPSWKVETFESDGDLALALKERDIDVFVNHSYGSFIENTARVGLYAVMFPHGIPHHTLKSLKSYHRVCAISPFTQIYVESLWGKDLKTSVLVPPISDSHRSSERVRATDKRKQILVVGRFNVLSHNKNQLLAVQAFAEMKRCGILDAEWELVVVGNVNASPENIAYVESCRLAGAGLPVSVLTNVTFDELLEVYQTASCLWQFTGFGEPYGENPQRCEHLGLVAMDCFAHGVIPLLYDRSGAAMLLQEGVTGWAFHTTDELKAQMDLVAREWGQPCHDSVIEALYAQSSLFDTTAFTATLRRVLMEEWR